MRRFRVSRGGQGAHPAATRQAGCPPPWTFLRGLPNPTSSRTAMSWAYLLGWLVILLPVQSSALQHIAVENATPDLLLLLLLFVSLYARRPDVFLAAWLIGLLKDVYSQNPCGLHAFAYLLVSLFVYRLRGEVFKEHVITRVFLTAVVSAALGAGALGLMAVVYPQVSWAAVLRQLTLSTIYTTLACPVVYLVFDGVRKLTGWVDDGT